tara:strand:+ start:272 stop:448 length:177 start_codon:yes stop_codon:yes gene_type:complete
MSIYVKDIVRLPAPDILHIVGRLIDPHALPKSAVQIALHSIKLAYNEGNPIRASATQQ